MTPDYLRRAAFVAVLTIGGVAAAAVGSAQAQPQRGLVYRVSPPAGLPLPQIDDPRRGWDTDERRPDGTRRYPNGDYTVTVRAWDAAGNETIRRDVVRVRN